LQDQLEGTENRISIARKDFNDAVQEYNSKIRSFPANLTAKMFGFAEKGYFAAEEGADKAPKVQF
jgi:LemA protein